MKWPKLKRDRIGMKAETARDMANGYIKLPAGSLVTVTSWHCNANIEGDPCPHCGVRVRITRVHERDLIPIELPKDKNRGL